MDVKVISGSEGMDFVAVAQLFEKVGWRGRTPEHLETAFGASYRTVFAVSTTGELVGCGRAVSDGVYYATLFDVLVHPDRQRQGIGQRLVVRLLEDLEGMPWISLSSNPGNESLFARFGFLKQRSAMAIVQDPFSEFLDV